jgi:tetratricopeptide (TPR) repeat protein
MVDKLHKLRSMLLIIIIPILFSCASAEYYDNRGLDYYFKGQYDQAISDYTKALEINPRFAEAYNNRGIAYFEKREYDKSSEDVKKALDLGYQVHPKVFEELRKASGRQN